MSSRAMPTAVEMANAGVADRKEVSRFAVGNPAMPQCSLPSMGRRAEQFVG
jgi:hypothetical protein